MGDTVIEDKLSWAGFVTCVLAAFLVGAAISGKPWEVKAEAKEAVLVCPVSFVTPDGKKVLEVRQGDYGTVFVTFDAKGTYLSRIEPGAPMRQVQVPTQPGPSVKK